jgi:predicted component of type VI protein secretion system
MEVKLVVTHKASKEVSEASFSVEDKVTIGRYLNSPVMLQGEGLSRYHYTLSVIDGTLVLEDLSSNGTWLNGALLKARMTVRLKSTDVIEVPGYRMQILFAAAPPTSPSTRTETSRVEPVPESKSVWARPLIAAAGFFEPLELAVVTFAAVTFALVSFYLTR